MQYTQSFCTRQKKTQRHCDMVHCLYFFSCSHESQLTTLVLLAHRFVSKSSAGDFQFPQKKRAIQIKYYIVNFNVKKKKSLNLLTSSVIAKTGFGVRLSSSRLLCRVVSVRIFHNHRQTTLFIVHMQYKLFIHQCATFTSLPLF